MAGASVSRESSNSLMLMQESQQHRGGAVRDGEQEMDDAEMYVEACRRYNVPVDPNVVIALRTQWNVLQPTCYFGEGGMLPLMGILEHNRHIRRLLLRSTGMNTFRAAGNGNSNARVLRSVLANNQNIEELDLTDTGLDDVGVEQICEGLRKNRSVVKLSLSRNHFGQDGARQVEMALTEATQLREVDLSRNVLGFKSVHRLRCCCSGRVEMNVQGNFVFEEILNALTHAIAFLAAVVGTILLMSEAVEHNTDHHFWSCLLFSFSMMFMFLMSTLYHALFMLPHASKVLHVLDHVGIYMMIAGSHTPFLLIGFHNSTPAMILCIAEWVCALGGSIFALCADLSNPLCSSIELLLFLSMGFGCCLVWEELMSLPPTALTLVVAGGASYVIGVVFFILGKKVPIYHVLWHVFVMVAAALHWFAVYLYFVRVDDTAAGPYGCANPAVMLDSMTS